MNNLLERYPEPCFTITIQPTLYNGDTTENGKRVYLTGFSEPITLTTIDISNSSQMTTLTSNDRTLASFEGIYIKGFDVENFIYEKMGNASIELTIRNLSIRNGNIIDNNFDLSSPFLDLFQSGFIVSISMYNPINLGDTQSLFVGLIDDYIVSYDNNNLSLNVNIESFLNVLNKSACVQTALDQNGQQIYINTLVSQIYNFDELLNKLFNETIISQSLTSIQYYKSPQEEEAVRSNGTAISTNTEIFVDTPPTDSKYTIIARALYPYQRIFYVNNAGDFIITPLQAYFDKEQNWQFTLSGEYGLMQALRISVNKRTSEIQNREVTSLLQLYSQFNPTTSTAGNVSAVAVATPNHYNNYFSRLNDFVDSQQYLQTQTSVQEINTNLLNNAGLLNIAMKFNNITGLVNKVINVDDNVDYITTTDEETNKIKFYLRLYAAKALAEKLFSETQVSVTIPTNLTYNQDIGQYRQIPLNQLVGVPGLYNNLFNGISQLFCFGYRISYNINTGAMTELFLTKPYTYTALWSDEKVEVLSISGFN